VKVWVWWLVFYALCVIDSLQVAKIQYLDLGLQCTKSSLATEFCPNPLGSLQQSPDPSSVKGKVLYGNGRGGEGRERDIYEKELRRREGEIVLRSGSHWVLRIDAVVSCCCCCYNNIVPLQLLLYKCVVYSRLSSIFPSFHAQTAMQRTYVGVIIVIIIVVFWQLLWGKTDSRHSAATLASHCVRHRRRQLQRLYMSGASNRQLAHLITWKRTIWQVAGRSVRVTS